MCLRHYLLLLMLVTATGCNQFNLQPQANLSDLVETRAKADAAYQQEDWPAAEKNYLELTRAIPSDVEPWFRLGNIYARTDKLDAAVGAYREALVHDLKNSKIWHNLGIVQLRQATRTFIEMQQYTEADDPLGQRAQHVVNAVSDLMATGFEAASP